MNPTSSPVKESKKIKISQQTYIIAALTLITVLIWVGFDIYRAATKSTLELDVRQGLTPLDPSLDTQVLSTLETLTQIPINEVKTFSFPIITESENEPEATTEAAPPAEAGQPSEN